MAISASEARKGLFPLIAKVNDDRVPIEITSKHGNAYLVAAEDWEAWQETMYLFSTPANAARLIAAAEAVRRGDAVERALDRE